jgi:hypothetical protein
MRSKARRSSLVAATETAAGEGAEEYDVEGVATRETTRAREGVP